MRQALALVLDRQALVDGLFQGKADLGNDSPFAPVFPSTDTSIPAAGAGPRAGQAAACPTRACRTASTSRSTRGTTTRSPTWPRSSSSRRRRSGSTSSSTSPTRGRTTTKFWLDSPLGITDYGHRGVPNVFLTAPLTSAGTWNAAHFKNSAVRRARRADFVAAVDVDSQQRLAGQIAGAPARRDADHLPVLLLPPLGDGRRP